MAELVDDVAVVTAMPKDAWCELWVVCNVNLDTYMSTIMHNANIYNHPWTKTVKKITQKAI